MLKDKMQDAMNQQINEEMYSAYLYLAMAAWFEDQNLSGFASWMKVQAQEEMTHAMKFYHHIFERQGRVTLKAIAEPDKEWDSPLAAFEAAYRHECHISECIDNLMALSEEVKDFGARPMLHWFVEEQIEEEASADEIVQKLKRVEGSPQALFMLDQEMGQRSFVYPPPALAGEGE
jgi:ferritin